MSDDVNQQLVLRARPTGVVTDDSFELVEQPVAAPAEWTGARAHAVAVVRARPARLAQRRALVRPARGDRRGDAVVGRRSGDRLGAPRLPAGPVRARHAALADARAARPRPPTTNPPSELAPIPARSRRPEVDAQRRRRDRDDGVLRDALRRSARRRRHRARHRRRRRHRFRRRAGRPQPRRCPRDRHGRVDGQARRGCATSPASTSVSTTTTTTSAGGSASWRPTATTSCSTTSVGRCSTRRLFNIAEHGRTRAVRVDLHRLSPGEDRRSGCTTTNC